MMIAALGTLPFLATLWLLGFLATKLFDESGAKIAAALRGETVRSPAAVGARRIATVPQARDCSCCVTPGPRWRAAA